MIWLALPLTAWAGVAAYIGWRWSVVRLADADARRFDARARAVIAKAVGPDPKALSLQQRVADTQDRAISMIERLAAHVGVSPPPPPSAELFDFAQRKRSETPEEQPPQDAA